MHVTQQMWFLAHLYAGMQVLVALICVLSTTKTIVQFFSYFISLGHILLIKFQLNLSFVWKSQKLSKNLHRDVVLNI